MDLNRIVVDQFDGIASFYDARSSSRQKYLDGIDKKIINFLSNHKNLDILDIGTGTGTRAAKINKALSTNKFYACDISPEMVKIAKTKGLDDVRVAGMPDLPYEKDGFDVILCLFNSFGYVHPKSSRLKTLKNFNNILKDGGYLIIDVLHRWNLGEGLNFKKPASRVIKELAVSLFRNDLEYGDFMFKLEDENGEFRPAYHHTSTKRELEKMFKQSGFAIEVEEIVGYDSGKTKNKATEGQLFYICKKAKQAFKPHPTPHPTS